MSLRHLYGLNEAGVQNQPTKEPKKKKSVFKHANGGAMGSSRDDDESWEDEDERHALSYGDDEAPDDDELGPDMDYEDPAEEPPARIDRSAIAKAEPESPKPAPFASKSAAPSDALKGGKTAGNVSADRETLEALQAALESVRTRDEDLQDWVDDCIREIGRAIRSGSQLTLPKFEATPDLDDFDDDAGDDEDF